MSNNLEEKVKGIKATFLSGKTYPHDAFLGLLSANEPTSVRIMFLKLISQKNMPKHQSFIDKVHPLLNDQDMDVVRHALEALVSLKAPGLGTMAAKLYQDQPSIREPIHRALLDFEWMERLSFFNSLPPEQASTVRSAVAHRIFTTDPDKQTHFLMQYRKDKNSRIKADAERLLNEAESIRESEIKEIRNTHPPGPPRSQKPKKGLLGKITDRKSNKGLKRLLEGGSIRGQVFQGETISGVDLSGRHLVNVDFRGAVLSDVNLSSANLESVSFNGAYLKNITFDNTSFDSVSFENAVLYEITAAHAALYRSDFTGSRIYKSQFDAATLQESLFIDAEIADTNFSRANLTATSFLSAKLSKVIFNSACLDFSDLSLVKATLCDFMGVDFSTFTTFKTDLKNRNPQFKNMVVPSIFFSTDPTQTNAFNSLMLCGEMEKIHRAFLGYNFQRIELSMDTLLPEQVELFELIPQLIHSNRALFPQENPIQNAPAGISGYHPSLQVLQLMEKYFQILEPADSKEDSPKIEGLYTIGSTGTIAQSRDSDIDYWICIDDSKIGEEPLERLQAKLSGIEKWAYERFNTELHFFVVPLSKVREDLFGGSDAESSGSAQGKILKEEFYRTMILVAGRVPLWCTIPPWAKETYYKHFNKASSQFHKGYLDLGNASPIPKGEYFGASIWQLLKGLKSPYKSVMKMALLEKYMKIGDEQSGLLCNRLKADWASGTYNLRQMDPYLLLFEGVLDYYQKTKQKDVVSLLQVCFFLKLGIQSIKDLDASVIPTRKNLVSDYINRWNWNESYVHDLGSYREWPFERIFKLSTRINKFMVGAYEKLSRSLQKSTDDKILIMPEDLTILGRKMFVQFSKQPHKVEKLPLIGHGRHLFKQLYVQYARNGNQTGTWQLVHQKKDTQTLQTYDEVLKELHRIEELVAWLVRNDLFTSTASLQLMPNPSPVSIQDLLDFVTELNGFFSLKEIESLPSSALLTKPHIHRLFLAINFCQSRRLSKIHEYTAIYMTSWGEFYCRTFNDEKGIPFVEDLVTNVKEQLGLPVSGEKLGYFIPISSRKRIKIKDT
jgi:adenylate cyclase class 1